jgi:hypothetical protein
MKAIDDLPAQSPRLVNRDLKKVQNLFQCLAERGPESLWLEDQIDRHYVAE